MITRITHITLFVSNQEEALKFYVDKLGFEIHTDAKFGDFRWLTINAKNQKDFELVLFPATKPEEKALVGKQAASNPILSLETQDCQKTYLELKQNGVKFLQEPKEKPWGIDSQFQDLYGNIFNLTQPKK